MPVAGTVAGVEKVVGPHVGQQGGHFVDRQVVDVKPDRTSHLDQVTNLTGPLVGLGHSQRTGLHEDLDTGPLFQVGDDLDPVHQHPGGCGGASELSEQPGGTAGRAVSQPFSLEQSDRGTA